MTTDNQLQTENASTQKRAIESKKFLAGLLGGLSVMAVFASALIWGKGDAGVMDLADTVVITLGTLTSIYVGAQAGVDGFFSFNKRG